jgi:hypothetical protein
MPSLAHFIEHAVYLTETQRFLLSNMLKNSSFFNICEELMILIAIDCIFLSSLEHVKVTPLTPCKTSIKQLLDFWESSINCVKEEVSYTLEE